MAQLLILDEPTNDLDTETLELLEERLVDYKGPVVLISHDRSFLNNVVTSTLVFESGAVNDYVGGYDDWLLQRRRDATPDARVAKKSAPDTRRRLQQAAIERQRRLSYKETRELEDPPAKIEALESELSEIHEAMGQPDFYRQVGEIIAEKQVRVKEIESELETSYTRWEELEERAV